MSQRFPRPEVLKKLFRAKEKRRQELARLPLKEKLRILIRLQTIAAGQSSYRSRRVKSVWKIQI